MSVAASRPPAPVVVPAPVPAPTPADREPGSAAFAELLRQSRGVERRPPAEATTPLADGRGGRSQATDSSASAAAMSDPDRRRRNRAGPRRQRAKRRWAGAGTQQRIRIGPRPSVPPAGAKTPDTAAQRALPAQRPKRTRPPPPTPPALTPGEPAHGARPDPRAGDAELRFDVAARRLAANNACGSDGDTAALNDRPTSAARPSPPPLARRPGSEAAGRADNGRGAARAARDGDAQGPSASFARILGEPGPAIVRPHLPWPGSRLHRRWPGPTPVQDAPAPAAVE